MLDGDGPVAEDDDAHSANMVKTSGSDFPYRSLAMYREDERQVSRVRDM